jgi:hypothetical protein
LDRFASVHRGREAVGTGGRLSTGG